MSPALAREHVAHLPTTIDRRDAVIAGLAVGLAVVATAAAELLVRAIALVTNLAYFGRLSVTNVAPADHKLGLIALVVPVIGGALVGLMARYGSRAIRGHGIPEAMEQILTNESRIPLRITFLKPASSAVAIGTGGPFGAEGPIIATGGALGSVLGQWVRVTADQRKTLLAAGAAAGMTAIFGTPLAAVMLAIELLLFEYRARSIVPVALAAAAAGGLRVLVHGSAPTFAMTGLMDPALSTTIVVAATGAVIGIASTAITRAVYAIEDRFERLPIHWMWWPMLGGVAVGVVGLVEPRTLGVGYSNIELALSGGLPPLALAALCVAKLVSWSIALGSGTSGGTLAPLLTLGSGLGWLLTAAAAAIAPHAGIDPRIGALVGMTAMFAGASRALLTSILFALEATQQIHAAVPIVVGVSLSYFCSCLLMRTSIMTEKLARRGVAAAGEYDIDPLSHVHVEQVMSCAPPRIERSASAGAALTELERAARDPRIISVVDGDRLVGVVAVSALRTADPERQVGALSERPAVTAARGETVRIAAERMARADVGQLVVVDGEQRPIGTLARRDIIAALRRGR